jgi:hypothetical protein
MVLLVGFVLSAMVSGCQESRVVVADDHPVYEAKSSGPPPWAPAHGYRAKHRYHYYPSSYVYLDIDRRLYFYMSGGSWRVSASLPVGISIEVGESVLLEMDTDTPYHYHTDVVKHYPPGQAKMKGRGKGKGIRSEFSFSQTGALSHRNFGSKFVLVRKIC